MKTLPNDHVFKKDETILVFPQSLFYNEQGELKDIVLKDIAHNALWMNRDLANANRDLFRQVATYAVAYRHNPNGTGIDVLVYHRKQGDKLLVGYKSIGIGGHPDIGDIHSTCPPSTAVQVQRSIDTAVHREVEEELFVAFPPHVGDDDITHEIKSLPWYLYDEGNDVGRAHIGVPVLMKYHPHTLVGSMDPDWDQVEGWVNLSELVERLDQFEPWSVSLARWLDDNRDQL